jgi:hypothetical protein
VLWFVGDVAFFVLDDDFFTGGLDDFTVSFSQITWPVLRAAAASRPVPTIGLSAGSAALPGAAGYYP